MRRLVLPALLLALAAPSLFAGGPDAVSRLLLSKHARTHASRADEAADSAEQKSPYIPLIVRLEKPEAIDSLLAIDAIIWRERDDMALVSIPRDSMDRAKHLGGLGHMSASMHADCAMDIARPYAGVDAAQAGQGLPAGYDGSGVVAGFSDIGFDANHIAFAGRVAQFSYYDPAYGISRVMSEPQEIRDYCTDDSTKFHATHVANILAGGYKGNPYYGVATGAEIAASASRLEDVGILCGVEDVIAYAKSAGKPAVVNLSLSHLTGPHDGTDLLCRYLSSMGREAIICCSAGNYGQRDMSVHHVFASDGEVRKATVNNSRTWDGFEVEGIADFWSADDRRFSFRVEIYDYDTRQPVFASPWVGGYDEPDTLKVDAERFPEFAEFMDGFVEVEAELSELNNRYEIAVYYNITTEEQSARGAWSRYLVSLAVRAGKGVEIYGYTDEGSYMGKVASDDSLNPNSDFAVSDMCTAENIVAVGACSTRNTAPAFNREQFGWVFPLDAPAAFSSYGHGLPHFCAPGNMVVSAVSGPYVERNPDVGLCAVANVDGADYYWFPECGTSMSAPYTAGVAALALEACPELTAKEFIAAAQATASADFDNMANPRWGAGCLDAYACLQRIISNSAADAEIAKPLVRVDSSRRLEITMPAGAAPAEVVLSTPSGLLCDPSSPLSPGLYILKIGKFPPFKFIVP